MRADLCVGVGRTQLLGSLLKGRGPCSWDPGRPDLGLHTLPAEMNQGSLGKGLILGPGHGQHGVSLGHLVTPGSKEVLNKKVACHKDSAASLTGLPLAEAWMV